MRIPTRERLAVFLIAVFVAGPCASLAGAQAQKDPAQKDAALHMRGLQAVQAERARAKQPFCAKMENTVDINSCYSNELGITDGNYLKLVRAIGALLRSGDDSAAAAQAPTPIPFDDGEAAWKSYREKACNAAGSQYEGGSMRPSIEMGCQLTITRHHIDERWALYSDLGTK